MKIITYNINGIRAVLKKDFLKWLEASNPDVLCLQETKAMEDQFDKSIFEDIGYHFHLQPAEKKGYSGVAILTKKKPIHVEYGCGIEKYDVEGRVIRVDFDDISVLSIYMPSGASKPERQLFKLQWLKDFQSYIAELTKKIPNLVITGDFNICHKPIDIHNPYRLDGYPGFTEEEREWMTSFLSNGFIDAFRFLNPDPHQYSWWSYMGNARNKNLGWRIDYILLANSLRNQLIKSRHLTDARHSDHCPVVVELGIR